MRLNDSGLDPERVLGFKPHFRVEQRADLVFLVAEGERFILSGNSAIVAGLLDGQRSVRALLEAAGALSSAALLEALAALEARGLLTDAPNARATTEGVFLSALGLDVTRRPCVSLAVLPRLAELSEAARRALTAADLDVAPDGALRLVVADDYLAPDVTRELAACRSAGVDCFLVKPTGLSSFIGPLLAADHGPCWACLGHAIERQRPVERLLSGADPERVTAPVGALAASVTAATSLAAVRLRQLLDPNTPLPRSARRELMSFDWSAHRTEIHQVRKRPQCVVCGDSTHMQRIGSARVALSAKPRNFTAEGGYRQRLPSETVARLLPLVSRVLGPITHLEPMPGRHSAERPVFSSGYLACPADVRAAQRIDRLCAGKGRSSEQARASALGEAIERLAGVYQGDEAVLRDRFATLGDEAVSLDALQLFSDAQFDAPSAAGVAPGARVPRRFDAETIIEWTPAWSLTNDRRRYVPLAFCYSDAPPSTGAEYCAPSSNGSAAGNCLEEAILQGALELIERDALAIWWYNRLRRPAVALTTLADPWIETLISEYRSLGFDLWVLDLTHDLEIPVVAAVACHAESQRFALGFGCHLAFELAVQRALSELNQVFDPEGSIPSPWDRLSAAREFYVRPLTDVPARSPREYPAPSGSHLGADIEFCVDRLRRRGLELLVVDKSRPDLELSVAQVIVPGLRHVWPRLAPGRLYNVPVALGVAARPLAETELNPHSLLV